MRIYKMPGKRKMVFAFSLVQLLMMFSAICAHAQDKKGSLENRQSTIPFESPEKKAQIKEDAIVNEDRWSDFLPIWGKEAREQGYELPLPFGVSLNAVSISQSLWADNLALQVGNNSIALDRIKINDMDSDSTNLALRFDVWLLPFFNIYGLLGEVEGEFSGLVDVPHIDFILPGGKLIPFSIDYDGTSKGLGATVAGGYENFFGVLDVNYTETGLDFVLDDAEALVVSARLGWNGRIRKWDGGFWVGAMSQDLNQTWRIPLLDSGVIAEVDTDVDEAVNYLLGARWNILREVELMLEYGGFADREQWLGSVSYRF